MSSSGGTLFGSMVETMFRPLMAAIWVPSLYSVIGSIGVILAMWERMDTIQDEHNRPSSVENYDFIVVGAGSGGSVAANRLSKHYNVLLLEAGGEPHPMQFIPGFGFFLINYPQLDWKFKTVPQKNSCFNSINQQSSWSAGRGLGGTGNLNLMVHLRGHHKDYEHWGNITGDPSWSWEGVLPYYKTYENHEDALDVDKRYHGFEGDLRIESPDYVGLGVDFIRAGNELGYPFVDLNGVYDEGFGVARYPIKLGVRQAPYKAFIEPVRSRKSLTIRKFAHVNRVLFKNGNEAYGVEYDRHGERHVVYASKEVVLSAGTISTPKILMLSGIGPKDHLQSLGIPVLRDLPVGKNLQDHASVYLSPFLIDKPRSFIMERDLTPGAYVDWFSAGTGPLSTSGVHASAAISSSIAKASGERDWPDIQMLISSVSVSKHYASILSKAFGLKLDEISKYYEHAIFKESFTLIVSGGRPRSRGDIKLGGVSPYDSPVINPNYLNDAEGQDVKVMIEGIKTALRLAENTTTFGVNLGAKFTQERLPGCGNVEFRSDAYWECYIRRYTVTLHHACGTVRMGKAESKESVVDTKLRVLGVKGLRVLDLSIMPVIILTNTQAPALMIGEKGADIILQHWKSNRRYSLDLLPSNTNTNPPSPDPATMTANSTTNPPNPETLTANSSSTNGTNPPSFNPTMTASIS